jgi:hypothetical protein
MIHVVPVIVQQLPAFATINFIVKCGIVMEHEDKPTGNNRRKCYLSPHPNK